MWSDYDLWPLCDLCYEPKPKPAFEKGWKINLLSVQVSSHLFWGFPIPPGHGMAALNVCINKNLKQNSLKVNENERLNCTATAGRFGSGAPILMAKWWSIRAIDRIVEVMNRRLRIGLGPSSSLLAGGWWLEMPQWFYLTLQWSGCNLLLTLIIV